MILLIDNLDMMGARDCTATIDSSRPPKITRKLNEPIRLKLWLVAEAETAGLPRADSRVQLLRDAMSTLFAGYVEGAPRQEYRGNGEHGAVLGYEVNAVGDEAAMERSPLPARTAPVDRNSGDVLRTATNDASGGAFDTTAIEDGAKFVMVAAPVGEIWTERAREIANQNRAAYRAENGAVRMTSVGATAHAIRSSDDTFSPQDLKLEQTGTALTDITAVGEIEPQTYVKDYFIGDGHTQRFAMSQQPFVRPSETLLEEEYCGDGLDERTWTVSDSTGAVQVSSGKLHVNAPAGTNTTVTLGEKLELGGAYVLEHGALEFTGICDGVAGGIYEDEVVTAKCLAGFAIATANGVTTIQAKVNGANSGTAMTTRAGCSYVLTTKLCASEVFRVAQRYCSSEHGADNALGGGTIAADLRVVLEGHEIDPANPQSQTLLATVLYDGVIENVPAFARYGLVCTGEMHCAISYTWLRRTMAAEARSTAPDQPTRSRLVGAVLEGAECTITTMPELYFYAPFKPVADEWVQLSYRGCGRAVARVADAQAAAANAKRGDNGVRAVMWRVNSPVARSSDDCRAAAQALLEDCAQTPWTGEYKTWTDFMQGDVYPGDAVIVDVPERDAQFTATLREVEMEMVDPRNERARYTLRFANDAAAPIAIQTGTVTVQDLPVMTAESMETTPSPVPCLAHLMLQDVTQTTMTVDAGATPAEGWGIEVRREGDWGWGTETDRNLVGRFTTRTFTLPRLGRTDEYYLRMFDNQTPPRYSRWTTLLHVDVRYDAV